MGRRKGVTAPQPPSPRRSVVWSQRGPRAPPRGREASCQSESGPGGPGGRQPLPGASRTSNKQSAWSGRGDKSRAAMVVRATCLRYLACPGQHPHRDSVHRLPLLEMRRGQLVQGAPATQRDQREPGPGARAGGAGTRGTNHPGRLCAQAAPATEFASQQEERGSRA